MTEQQAELVGRLRELLATEPSTREVSMFGGVSFMVDDRLIASAMKDGGLLVRVATDRHEELVAEPGASQAEMGAGRSMGPGWIAVSADAVADEGGLEFWLDAALEHRRAAG